MISSNITQLDFDTIYIKACNNGDLSTLIELYDKYKPITSKNKFSIFLKIGQSFKKSFDFTHAESVGFEDACRKGCDHIVNYLINVQKLDDKEIITRGLFEALENNELEIVKFLAPHITRGVAFYDSMYNKFKFMCVDGSLSAIKYLLTDKTLNIPVNDLLNHSPTFNQEPHEGFISACTMGQTEIVRYLTSSPDLTHHIELQHIQQQITIRNPDILHHFIFELNLSRDHKFMKNVIFVDENLMNQMFEKRDLFNRLNSEISNDSIKNTHIKKRPKV